MKRRTCTLLGGLLWLGACRDASPPAPTASVPAAARPAEMETAETPDVVRIRSDMLRDLHLTTTAAELRSSGEGVTALGEVGVDERAYAEVGALMPARVVRALVFPGDRVDSGQPLAILQSAEIGRARANLLAARADAALARTALERKRRLAPDRVVPAREVQEAEAAASAADANVEAARAALTAFGAVVEADGPAEDLATFTLRAPIAGSVIARTAVIGGTTDAPRTLFRIADLSRLWLTVHVFERDALRVHSGVPARLTFPALPGKMFNGVVRHVGLEVDVQSRTIPVRVEFDNIDSLLRPGMSATAWLPLGEGGETLIAVPTVALQRLADGWVVFFPRGEGRFEIRLVGRGRDLGGEVEILNGVQAGDVVVVDGAFLLKAEAEKSRGDGAHEHHH